MEAKGVVVSEKIARLRFAIGGKVSSITVGLGSTVSAGQKVATLDSKALQAYLDRALKTYEKERTMFDKKGKEKLTEEQRSILQDELDMTVKSVEIAKANVDECTLTTPISGTVAAIEPERIVPGVNITPAGFSITVMDLSSLLFHCLLHPEERVTVAKDKPVVVRVEGIGKHIDGTVMMVGILPDSNGLYPVDIRMNDTSGLIPGLPGTAHW